jgi:hypothetical protein
MPEKLKYIHNKDKCACLDTKTHVSIRRDRTEKPHHSLLGYNTILMGGYILMFQMNICSNNVEGIFEKVKLTSCSQAYKCN